MYDDLDYDYVATPKADALVKQMVERLNEMVKMEYHRQERENYENDRPIAKYDHYMADEVRVNSIDYLARELGVMLMREEINEWEYDDIIERMQ